MRILITLFFSLSLVACGDIGSTGSSDTDDTEELLETATTDETVEGERDGYYYSLQEREDLYLITFSRFNLEIIIDINTGNTLIGKECEKYKVCRGMTAQEVRRVVGAPTSVDVSTNEAWHRGHFTEWEWDDAGAEFKRDRWGDYNYMEKEGDICAEDIHWGCDMKFQSIQVGGERFLILIELNDINGKYIDVTQF